MAALLVECTSCEVVAISHAATNHASSVLMQYSRSLHLRRLGDGRVHERLQRLFDGVHRLLQRVLGCGGR